MPDGHDEISGSASGIPGDPDAAAGGGLPKGGDADSVGFFQMRVAAGADTGEVVAPEDATEHVAKLDSFTFKQGVKPGERGARFGGKYYTTSAQHSPAPGDGRVKFRFPWIPSARGVRFEVNDIKALVSGAVVVFVLVGATFFAMSSFGDASTDRSDNGSDLPATGVDAATVTPGPGGAPAATAEATVTTGSATPPTVELEVGAPVAAPATGASSTPASNAPAPTQIPAAAVPTVTVVPTRPPPTPTRTATAAATPAATRTAAPTRTPAPARTVTPTGTACSSIICN